MELIETILAALSSPRHRERHLRFHTGLEEAVLVAESVSGYEAVDGGGYRFELTALSVDAGLDVGALLSRPVGVELQTAGGGWRSWHGHVTAFEREGSNGGLARYRLTLEPWLSFLTQRLDSYVFHDKRVVEIVEDVFADYAALAPSWRWDLGHPDQYARRSLTTQYEETDFAFVSRLLAEEGIYYWFEHESDPDSATNGRHTLVLSDHDGAFSSLGPVRYHRTDATEAEDSIQQWQRTRRWHGALLERSSWDYRSLSRREVSAEAEILGDALVEDVDTSGPYAYRDLAEGERRVRQHLEARLAASQLQSGLGTWRELSAGHRFELRQHPSYPEGAEFVCVRVTHWARNNLDAELVSGVEQALGALQLSVVDLPEALRGLDGERRREPLPLLPADHFYRNAFTVLPSEVTYRPQTRDGHGLWLHPKPKVYGTQSAIVVSDGAPLDTDRDHRIKVQFAWQRGASSSSGEGHPGGDDDAPGTSQAWTWVRVATSWAGENWGGVFIPRRGQEVLVGFLEGDIDRPVVLGAVYNGRGHEDAQHNAVSGGNAGATGNAAAWFEGNGHQAVQVGFKSQELDYSQEGTGGYHVLRLDDTPGEGRVQLGTTQHLTQLTLGHQKGGRDNVRGADQGYGVSLTTQASGALRGGSGLWLTTEAGSSHLTATGALSQLGQSEHLLETLSSTAHAQGAVLSGEPEVLAVQTSLQQVQATHRAKQRGWEADEVIGGGAGEVPGWDAPLLSGYGVDGVLSVTPGDQIWVSGTQTGVVTGTDLNWLSQGAWVTAASGGVVLFTHGGEAPQGKPNQERGIALHAAQGKVSGRSHKSEARLAAKRSVRIASTESEVEVTAPSGQVLTTAQGAYLRITNGLIELCAPGQVAFKSNQRLWQGPASGSGSVALPEAKLEACEFQLQGADKSGAALVPLDTGDAMVDRVAARAKDASGTSNWTVDELLDVLCPDDQAVVDDLAQTNVEVASKIYYDDLYYNGTQWETNRFDGGGSWDGSTLLMLDAGTAEDAATTAYHELVHKHQPSSMSMLDREIEAYTKTEQWAIDRGYPGQGVPDFRMTNAAGETVPNVAKITEFVKAEYPIQNNPGPRPIDLDADGHVILSDGSVRPPRAGDVLIGYEQVENLRKIPRSAWKCPCSGPGTSTP